MSKPVRGRVTLTDSEGSSAVTLFYVVGTSQTTQTTLGSDIAACSNGNYSRLTREVDLVGPSFAGGTDAPYPSTEDMAVLNFKCDDGTAIFLQIPAPKAEVFLGDNETVDVDDTLVAALIAYFIAHGCNINGSPVVSYNSGYRTHTR